MAAESIIDKRKYYKRNKILNIIRSGENISRFDVKKLTMYSMSTVLSIIDELIADGMVREVECEEPRVGRRPVWLRLNPDGGYFIGTEFNGLKLHCAVLNFAGETVYRSEEAIHAENGSEQILATLTGEIRGAMDFAAARGVQVFGVGVGIPGYLDKPTGVALSHSRLRGWENIPIRKIIEETFRLPCYLDNNVNVMAFAYKWLKYRGDCQDFLFVSIRTGIRVVPVINNHLVLSRTGLSGELGHVKLSDGGAMCSCGSFGCLNSELSDLSVLQKLQAGLLSGRFPELLALVQGRPENVTMELFRASVLEGHRDSLLLLNNLAKNLGQALGMALNILAPEAIVLSGELAQIGKPFVSALTPVLEKAVIPEIFRSLQVTVSEFDDYIGAVGAGAYVMQEEFEFIDKPV